jgi:hypothetical protein
LDFEKITYSLDCTMKEIKRVYTKEVESNK